MPSSRRPGLLFLWILLLALLVGALSACAAPIVLTQGALPCGEMVEASGLLEPTPGAALPASDAGGEWVAFGDRQTGQLDKANADKGGVRGILTTCADWQAKAAAAAKPRPWWKLWR